MNLMINNQTIRPRSMSMWTYECVGIGIYLLQVQKGAIYSDQAMTFGTHGTWFHLIMYWEI